MKLKLKLDSDSGESKNTSFFEALAEAQVISTALSMLFMKQDSVNEVCLCPRCICMLCLSSLFCSWGLLSTATEILESVSSWRLHQLSACLGDHSLATPSSPPPSR